MENDIELTKDKFYRADSEKPLDERDSYSVIDGFFIPKIRKSNIATTTQSAITYSDAATNYIETFNPIKIQSKSPTIRETTATSVQQKTTKKSVSSSLDWSPVTPSHKEIIQLSATLF